jgi:hypothetical protein
MAEPLPPHSLARAREQKISELSTHFANDDLSLEDLETRIERVYKANSVVELEMITSDLRAQAALVDPRLAADAAYGRVPANMPPSVPSTFEVAKSRMLSIMGSTRRVGRWAVPRDLDVLAIMSDTKIDLTNAALPIGGVVTIELRAVMTSFRLIVPPDVRVVNEMHSLLSDVRSSADELPPPLSSQAMTPTIRLVGTAFMSDVKVKVRRREEPIYDDDDQE